MIDDFCKYCDNIHFQEEIAYEVTKLLEHVNPEYYKKYSSPEIRELTK